MAYNADEPFEGRATPEGAVPEQPPQRSIPEQIIDKTMETVRASGELTGAAIQALRATLLGKDVPKPTDIVLAANKEEPTDATP